MRRFALEVDTARRPLIVVANKWDLVRGPQRTFAGKPPFRRRRSPAGRGAAAAGAADSGEAEGAEKLLKKDLRRWCGRGPVRAAAPLVLTCA